MAEGATTTDSGPNRFERRRQANRAALIEAAWVLFQRQGIRGTKVEEICARADVSTRTFFNHFETREHLYRAISEMRSREFAAMIDAAAAGSEGFEERLISFLRSLGAALNAQPAYRELVAAMFAQGMEHGGALRHGGALGDATLRFVEAALARDELGSDAEPRILADVLLGTILVAIANWCGDDAFDLESELVASATVLLGLFQPRSS